MERNRDATEGGNHDLDHPRLTPCVDNDYYYLVMTSKTLSEAFYRTRRKTLSVCKFADAVPRISRVVNLDSRAIYQ
jgi:hypothetical protein